MADAERGEGEQRRPPAAVPTYSVRFLRSGVVVQCRANEPVLVAARRVGLMLAFYCMRGECRSCIQPVRGPIDVRGKTLTAADREQGLALLCVGRPLGDLEVDA